jgi:hypothetical protein
MGSTVITYHRLGPFYLYTSVEHIRDPNMPGPRPKIAPPKARSIREVLSVRRMLAHPFPDVRLPVDLVDQIIDEAQYWASQTYYGDSSSVRIDKELKLPNKTRKIVLETQPLGKVPETIPPRISKRKSLLRRFSWGSKPHKDECLPEFIARKKFPCKCIQFDIEVDYHNSFHDFIGRERPPDFDIMASVVPIRENNPWPTRVMHAYNSIWEWSRNGWTVLGQVRTYTAIWYERDENGDNDNADGNLEARRGGMVHGSSKKDSPGRFVRGLHVGDRFIVAEEFSGDERTSMFRSCRVTVWWSV